MNTAKKAIAEIAGNAEGVHGDEKAAIYGAFISGTKAAIAEQGVTESVLDAFTPKSGGVEIE